MDAGNPAGSDGAPAFLTPKDVCRRYRYGRSTYHNKIRDGLLPPAVAFTPYLKRQRDDELARIDRAVIGGATPAEVRELVAQIVAERRSAA